MGWPWTCVCLPSVNPNDRFSIYAIKKVYTNRHKNRLRLAMLAVHKKKLRVHGNRKIYQKLPKTLKFSEKLIMRISLDLQRIYWHHCQVDRSNCNLQHMFSTEGIVVIVSLAFHLFFDCYKNVGTRKFWSFAVGNIFNSTATC